MSANVNNIHLKELPSASHLQSGIYLKFNSDRENAVAVMEDV
jgi:hypothetical protein